MRGYKLNTEQLRGVELVDSVARLCCIPLLRPEPAAERPWTEKLWIYDLRTNKHFTLKENPVKRSDLDDFVACYNPTNRHDRKESERFKSFTYEDLTKRDKLNLDILIHSLPLPQPLGLPVWFAAAPRLKLWLKDESLEDSANLPPPDTIAAEIIEDLQAVLAQFAEIASDLKR
jgi:type I restriction enzyme M protein